MPEPVKPFNLRVWVAINGKGHLVPFAGYSVMAKGDLDRDYQRQYGRSLADHGYRVIKARLTNLEPKP